MFATSRKTSTASAVTSGPTPSPGRTTMFSLIFFQCCDLSQLFEAVSKSFTKAVTLPALQTRHLRSNRTRPLRAISGDHCFLWQIGLGCNQRDQILIVNSLLAIGEFGK